jgi:hypothetical protein
MAKKDKVFNDRKRKIFRKRIPDTEALFGIVFVGFTVLMGVWFIAQSDNYDPTERDISMTLMEEGSVEDNLYRTPLERWVDPSMRNASLGPSQPQLGVFPEPILEGGWQPSTRLQEFVPDTLFEKINGAAPQYINFGFQKLHFIGIEQPGSDYEINIELYDMAAFENAMGIFSAQRDASREVLTEGPVYYYETSIGAIGIVGPYYFKLTGTAEDAVISKKARQMVRTLAKLTSAADMPKAYDTFLNLMGIPFDRIAFEKSSVFQYDFANDFWFASPIEGEDQRYYVHEAESAEAAQALMDQLLQEQLFEYDLVEEADASVTLKHKFLDTYMTIERSENVIYGVEGAPAEEGLHETMATLQGAFLNEEG